MEEEEEEAEEQYLEDDEYEPSEQEIVEYCEWLGMDPKTDKVLTWIAREALKAPLPENWKICYTEEREVYYFNVRTGESIWDHPMDAYYKALFRQEKVKLEKKRRKMRLFSGSLPILPLQDYYNEITEEEQPESSAVQIPEHLIDPIDLRLFLDPVVLPTSGRTVSKHTIVNNKWRDPFSREYIENRRLIPNVDKRNEVTNWLDATTVKHFRAVTSSNNLQPLLRLIPYVLDKECEVSLKAQNLILEFFKKLFSMPAPASGKEASSPPSILASQAAAYSSARRNGRRLTKTTPRNKGNQVSSSSSSSSSSSASNGGSGASSRAGTAAMNNPRPPPFVAPIDSNASSSRGYYELMQLTDDEANSLVGCLLTMSTATSIENLYLILDAVPQLRCVTPFRGYSPEVLNVLHLSPSDLAVLHTAAFNSGNQPAWSREGYEQDYEGYSGDFNLPSSRSDASGAEPVSPSQEAHPARHRQMLSSLQTGTTNPEFVVQLKWIVLLMDYPNHLNILEKLDWSVAVHLIILIVNSIPDILKTRITLVCRLLRGLEGWPGRLKECSGDVIQWLIDLTLMDSNPWNQILLIYDLLVNGGEAAVENIKKQKSIVVDSLFAASVSDSGPGITYASMLGALLVFQDCFKLNDFGHNKLLEMSVASDLLPRLTRQQWKPKHFEHTINCMMASIQKDPAKAWQIMGSKAVGFLIKELSKKKKNCEDLRVRLENCEATEKRLEAANSTTNWALLYLKMHQLKEAGGPKKQDVIMNLIEEHEAKKADIEADRVANLLLILQTLLFVRLKPKQHRDREAMKRPGEPMPPATEKAQRADIPVAATAASSVPQVPSIGFSRGRRREKYGKDGAIEESVTPYKEGVTTETSSAVRRSLEGSRTCMLPPIM
jgi:hypothetical protein|uniref:WW domain-containing protein n=1 Tax=Eutreptiella gymnastica TaxID=73025 RepID=A0A7S4GDX8_9EUGL|mmetsp:Transcript_18117/g.31546  ORF Transcript_18117/g.31546 Transcript_18117/m.31546 type:complete len:888 (+) Transcript_18117:125-2788(+)|eukprot:CAMPEP_0174310522 /NCGR_PEP_ID=MMETSP0810-20121108/3097_1 /TAXON_ID=73025 ORGANISM="Eutreptiella gymnastica-like, Strain CCMP1594" /NCGR_SAMPLE_ID=MMETSP0810 /ASSEMBLY_ACC=CAM_ASM_000659 /LENGTH=887 /DNA_ID=CAMNT_0015418445 /DNA_START=123 /DNA_END=2786 /DNA_ORIENTATION=+